MAKRPGLPATPPSDAALTSGDAGAQPNPPGRGRGGPRGPRKPRTPPVQLGFLLSGKPDSEEDPDNKSASAYSKTHEQVLEDLRRQYEASAFRPHLEKVVAGYEADAEEEKQRRRAAIWGSEHPMHVGPMATADELADLDSENVG